MITGAGLLLLAFERKLVSSSFDLKSSLSPLAKEVYRSSGFGFGSCLLISGADFNGVSSWSSKTMELGLFAEALPGVTGRPLGRDNRPLSDDLDRSSNVDMIALTLDRLDPGED